MSYSFHSFRWQIKRSKVTLRAVRDAKEVGVIARELLWSEPSEVLLALYLDTQFQITGYSEVTRGLIDTSLVHPREVFRGAILANAASLIVAHNHPSGVALPSDEDRVVTRALVAAGVIIGIPVMDHVIVGRTVDSFAENGLL
jgi:DNA repair protein RadC